MGLFNKKGQIRAQEWDKRADQEAATARAEARKADAYRRSLASGKSQDPAADRYMIRQHDSNRRVAAANARDFRKTAERSRKWWL
ncbi:hypothetical protein N5079_19895 [Planotetraspora sp. A-T 1434]|uniref:hypothetical protein n=1 Tax=Planotetraspora sp. A-T 1434 TaxID=2979219 RepID=UPI0021BFD24E|nr:hypothetical protein [Planotetraspora sp. A-T 1434]MCT9932468.1 hypothetical protein [Planotetraspora sp. A-T 1434]